MRKLGNFSCVKVVKVRSACTGKIYMPSSMALIQSIRLSPPKKKKKKERKKERKKTSV